jgi:hypothetical protein
MSTPNDAHQEHRTFTARATLVAIGIKVRQIGLLKPIFQNWTLDKNPPAPVISRAQCRTFKISQSGREAAPEP